MDTDNSRDKPKDIGIILEQQNSLKYAREVMRMAVSDPELLNAVYKEISEKLGMDTAMEIYRMFKGQQISFPSEIKLSTIICSQREPASWSSMILNDEVSSNAIMKRSTRHYIVVIKLSTTA